MNDKYYWAPENTSNYYETDYSQLQNQPLEFNTLDDYGGQIPQGQSTLMYTHASLSQNNDFEEEPPLLDELEIYPDRIFQKMLAVLNPLKTHCLTDDADYLNKDSDLAGPIFFYLILAVSLFLSGNRAHFGYIYGISVISCVGMYFLLTLMTPQNVFSFQTVASVLGYSIIPIVGLSVLGILISLKGVLGLLLAALAVFWSSLSASRLFVAIAGDKGQQPLIAYPCALVSAVYILLVIF